MKEEDEVLRVLAALPPIVPEPGREILVRRRCHLEIRKRAGMRTRQAKERTGPGLGGLAAAAGLCLYLAAMLTVALRLSLR